MLPRHAALHAAMTLKLSFQYMDSASLLLLPPVRSCNLLVLLVDDSP
jgi:hypothetical protein